MRIRRLLLGLAAAALLSVSAFGQRLVIYTEDYPPYNFVDKATGALTGSAVEIVRAIQQQMNDTTPITLVPWARGYAAIQGAPNIVLFSMARTPERVHLFKWVGPILHFQWGLYVKKGTGTIVKNLEDARRLPKIGVVRGDFREAFFLMNGFQNTEAVTSDQQNVLKLMNGRISAFAGVSPGLAENLREAGFALSDVEASYVCERSDSYIAFSRQTDDRIVARWAAALSELAKNGTLARILGKWYPGETF